MELLELDKKESGMEGSQEEHFFMEDRDVHKEDFTTGYDYCLVLPMADGGITTESGRSIAGFTQAGIECIDHLETVGLDYVTFKGCDQKEIFVLIRASVQLLRSFAELIEFELPLCSEKLRSLIEDGDEENGIDPLHIAHLPDESSIYPYQYIHGPYRSQISEDIYLYRFNMPHPFCETVRLRLTQRIVETITLTEKQRSKAREGSNRLSTDRRGLNESLLKREGTSDGKDFDFFNLADEEEGKLSLRQQLMRGNVLGFFPLHNKKSIEHLRRICLNWTTLPWQIPTNKLAVYFGEKIALYFDFIGHYSKWLLVPAIIGIPIQIIILAEGNYSSYYQVIYASIVLLWGILMLETWKRKEALTSLKRGMANYLAHEPERPEFRGVLTTSHINGEVVTYFPVSQRRKRIGVSFIIIGAMIGAVIGVVIGIYIMRAALSESLGSSAQIIASLLNAVQIQVFNGFYPRFANALTVYENHRTDSDYSDSMTTKLFFFSFVNSYSSFFYIAFIARSDDCDGATCMPALAVNLAVIFAVRELSSIRSEALVPWLLYRYAMSTETELLAKEEFTRKKLTAAEIQFLKPRYDVMRGAIEEYASVAIQYGYIILFAAALPIAPLPGFIAALIEFLNVYRRPTIRTTENIGAWQSILAIISTVSVVTNAGIIVFTMNIFDEKSKQFQFWFFILYQWIILGFQVLLEVACPDVPAEVKIQLSRQEFLVERAIFKIPGEVFFVFITCLSLMLPKDFTDKRSSHTYGNKGNFRILEAVESDGCIVLDGIDQNLSRSSSDVSSGNSPKMLSSEAQSARLGSLPLQHNTSLRAKLERSRSRELNKPPPRRGIVRQEGFMKSQHDKNN